MITKKISPEFIAWGNKEEINLLQEGASTLLSSLLQRSFELNPSQECYQVEIFEIDSYPLGKESVSKLNLFFMRESFLAEFNKRKMAQYPVIPLTKKILQKKMIHPRPTLFLDRDGVLIEDVHYLNDINSIKLQDSFISDLQKIASSHEFIVLTNQAGIAKNHLTFDDHVLISSELERLLQEKNISLQHQYFCPYHEEAKNSLFKRSSYLRKPKAGMLLLALEKFDIDIRNSFMIGDKVSDQLNVPYLQTLFIPGKYPLPEDLLSNRKYHLNLTSII